MATKSEFCFCPLSLVGVFITESLIIKRLYKKIMIENKTELLIATKNAGKIKELKELLIGLPI
ncbi:MAG: hypothetical protein M3367_08445, partial [Acidobacteriota bacterium]|nr:hypothetical protein [Acidobacteriota bacterium]